MRGMPLMGVTNLIAQLVDPCACSYIPTTYLLYLLYIGEWGDMGIARDAGTLTVGVGVSQEQDKSARRRNLTAQVNVRIAGDIKDGADRALAAAGIAPREAIRALYMRAMRLGSSLRSLSDLVVGAGEDDEIQDSREAAFARATHAFDTMLAQYGFSVDVEGVAPMTEEEIEEAAYQDYLAEGTL